MYPFCRSIEYPESIVGQRIHLLSKTRDDCINSLYQHYFGSPLEISNSLCSKSGNCCTWNISIHFFISSLLSGCPPNCFIKKGICLYSQAFIRPIAQELSIGLQPIPDSPPQITQSTAHQYFWKSTCPSIGSTLTNRLTLKSSI